ncbi:20864_t:CDS:2, partial [Dentiscutata erythropus]
MHSTNDCSAYSCVQKLYACKKITIIENENLKTLPNAQTVRTLLRNDSTDVAKLQIELRQFEHENILKVYGLTHGEKNNSLSWDDKLSLAYQVTKGLKFLHDNGIIHPELHPKNILMHNLTPKITHIGISKFHTTNGLPFTPYTPPQYLSVYNTIDKTKLNIYSLGVLMWEISSNGVEPFYKKFDDKRPSCSEILEELKNISYDNSINDDLFMDVDLPANINETVIVKDCILDFDDFEGQMMKKVQFVNRFSLNKGRIRDRNDFIIGKKHILDNNGELKLNKIDNFNPIVYLAKGNWKILNDFGVLSRSDSETPFSDVEIIRINIPIGTVEHYCGLNKEFVQKIEEALNILDVNEKRRKLREKFDKYGDYIITKVTIGGAIIIDCSNINAKNLSRLQAYLRWGIEFAKGKMPSIFEDESLDGFPPFRTSPPRSMKTVKDLYSWLKDLYDYKEAELISYEDYKPSYELLSDSFKKQIVECFSLLSINKTLPVLIPQLPSEVEQKSFSEWLSLSKPSLLFHAYDWVSEFSLRYNTFVQSSELGREQKIAFKFLKEPKITPINKISVLLAQPQTNKMAYLLENNVAVKKTDQLNFNETPDDYFSLLCDPLEDSQHSNNPHLKKILCQIKFSVAEISFDLSSIILSEPFLDAADKSSESFQTYESLSEVFKNHYRNLLPETLIIGGILSRSYEQNHNTIDVVNSQQIDFEENDFCFQEKFEDFLTNLSGKYNIDTSLFFSNEQEAIKQNQIGYWYSSLKDNPDNWKIISLEDWRQIYKVDLNDNNYHIVFNGENSLTQDNQSELIIEFPKPLTDNNYQIYGSVIKKNKYKSWERVQEAMVAFDHTDQHKCVALIHKSNNIRLNKDTTKVLWFVLAKSEGYCANNYIDIKVGKLETSGIPTNVCLKTEGIYTDSVLVTSFVPKQQKSISPYNINIKCWSSNTVVLKVKNTIESNSVQNLHEKVILHWCMIDTNGKLLVNDKETRPWNLYGNIFNEKSRKAVDPIYYGPSDPYITPEKANDTIELYCKQNNVSRKTFIGNKGEKSPTVIKFTGYVKTGKKINENKTQEITRHYEEFVDFGDPIRQLTDKILEEKQKVEKHFNYFINGQNGVILGGLLYFDEIFENDKSENGNFESKKTWFIQIPIRNPNIRNPLETEPTGKRDRSKEIASNNDFALKIPSSAISYLLHSLFQETEIGYVHKSPSHNENFSYNGYNHIPSLNSLVDEIKINIFRFILYPKNLSLTCKVDYEKLETYTSSIKFLTLSSTYYHWALMTFKVDSPITSLCFNDILQTRISIDIRRQNSNMTFSRTIQCEIEIACNIYNIYCNTGNFFLPTYMELICHASETEILGPLFEGYLPELYNLPITFPFPLLIVEDGDAIQLLPLIVNDSNNYPNFIKKNVRQTDSKQLIKEWSIVLKKMNREIDSNRVEFPRNFKDYFKAFMNLLN